MLDLVPLRRCLETMEVPSLYLSISLSSSLCLETSSQVSFISGSFVAHRCSRINFKPVANDSGSSALGAAPCQDGLSSGIQTSQRDSPGANSSAYTRSFSCLFPFPQSSTKPQWFIPTMSVYGSAPMDTSEGPSPWGTSPPTDPAAYFTASMMPNYEIRDPEKAFLDKKPENNSTLPDYVTPLAVQEGKPACPDQSSSADSPSVSQLQRSQFNETECYNELCRLGNGGNGNCFLLQRRSDNVLRVCKVIHSKPKYKNLRPNEAEILQRILPPHERIVRMHELIVTAYTAEMYFDYYDGGDLDQLMNQYFKKRMMLEENFVWHCYQQLSEALAYIHTGYNALSEEYKAPPPWSEAWTPIIHGDIKPLNIFIKLSPDGSFPSLVLGDFGNSQIRPGRSLLGTLPWMPPEVPEYSVQSDVWGVGAIIHALCHRGRPPMRPFPSDWTHTPANIEAWNLKPSTRTCMPLGPEYSLNLNKCLEINMQWKPADRPSSNELLDWVNDDVLDRYHYFCDRHTIGRKGPGSPISKDLVLRSSDSTLFGEEQSSFAQLELNSAGIRHVDQPQNVKNLAQSPDEPEPLQQIFRANRPPRPELDNQPRYLGSLPDRNPYRLQDVEGNWFTGDEPVQPNWDMDLQPDDYSKNELDHDAVSTISDLFVLRPDERIARAIEDTLLWLLL